MTETPFTNFLLHWVEWIVPSGLGTGGVLPTASAANYFLGDYATADGVFINPATTVTDAGSIWVQSTISFSYTDTDPSVRVPGSIGDAIYYSRATGPFKSTQTLKIDQPILSDVYTTFKTNYDAYTTTLNSYNTKKDAYNSALKNEKSRQADFMTLWFNTPITIPARPCPPTQPMAFSGPMMKLSQGFGTSAVTWTTIAGQTDQTAYLAVGSTHMPTVFAATRYGYLSSTGDTSQATQPTGKIGHIFGRLGQGDATEPTATATGFYWGNSGETSNIPGMMISVFPDADSETGITDPTKFLKIDGKGNGWEALANFEVPARPAAAVAPDASGASSLAGSVFALGLIALSLY